MDAPLAAAFAEFAAFDLGAVGAGIVGGNSSSFLGKRFSICRSAASRSTAFVDESSLDLSHGLWPP